MTLAHCQIGELPHCLSSLKDWEKIKATASNDEVRYSRKGPDANRGKAKTIKLKRLIFRRLI